MPNRNDDEYRLRHMPSPNDKSKIDILWDQRHDCEASLKDVFTRLRKLEDEMTIAQTIRASGARVTVWVSSLCTGTLIAILNYVLNHWGK